MLWQVLPTGEWLAQAGIGMPTLKTLQAQGVELHPRLNREEGRYHHRLHRGTFRAHKMNTFNGRGQVTAQV